MLRRIRVGSGARYLTDSGRLYFDSADSLCPSTPTKASKTSISSSPRGSGLRTPNRLPLSDLRRQRHLDSNFLGDGRLGKNVFFTTRDQLVAADRDELIDLYDAREDGGPPPPGESPPGRIACRPRSRRIHPGLADPVDPGNVKPKGCKKGQVKKKGSCVKKHKPKTKAKKPTNAAEVRSDPPMSADLTSPYHSGVRAAARFRGLKPPSKASGEKPKKPKAKKNRFGRRSRVVSAALALRRLGGSRGLPARPSRLRHRTRLPHRRRRKPRRHPRHPRLLPPLRLQGPFQTQHRFRRQHRWRQGARRARRPAARPDRQPRRVPALPAPRASKGRYRSARRAPRSGC